MTHLLSSTINAIGQRSTWSGRTAMLLFLLSLSCGLLAALSVQAQTYTPNGVTVAGGNDFGSDTNQLNVPIAVFVDGSGAVYVADQDNHRVQKWASGAISGTGYFL